MPVGVIHISGVIGSYTDELGQPVKGVEVVDVVSQLKDTIDCESLDVIIKSPGGRCSVGYKIYDLLRAQKKPIRTIIDQECCSIATIIYLAGDVREPISADAKFMIHNPWLVNVSGNADELLAASEDIREEEEKMLSYYSKITGISKSLLHPLMQAETYLSAEQALQFNFSTSPVKETGAIAFKRDTNMSEVLLKKLKAFAISVGAVKDDKKVAIQLKSGDVTLDIANDVATIGDPVMVDGAPAPDGDYVIDETGLVITVVSGVITNITDPSTAGYEDMMAENAALKAEVATLKDQVAKSKEFEKEATETLAMIQKTMGEGYTPPQRRQSFGKQKEDVAANRVKEAAERKKAYK